MKSQATNHKKLARFFAHALENETAYLRRRRLLTYISGLGGGIVAGLSFGAATTHFSGTVVPWLVAFGAIGGLGVGLSLCFEAQWKQWPILRRFINEQAVKEAAQNEEL